MPLPNPIRTLLRKETSPHPSANESESVNRLGLRIFAKLSEPDSLISPYSIAAAFHLASEGTVPGSVANTQFRELLDSSVTPIVSEDDSVTLRVATSAWVGDVRDEYVSTVKSFGAEVRPLPNCLDDINSWVSNATDNQIETILDELPRPLIAILLNAVFFKADWRIKFKESDTVSHPFQNADDVMMMMLRDETFPYKQVKSAAGALQVVEVPYGNGEFSAVFVVPSEGVRIGDVVKLLEDGDDEWQRWINGSVPTKLDVLGMPRMKLEYGAKSLKNVLQEMGLQKPWEIDTVDPPFWRMSSDREAYLSDFVHKATVEFTEEGTVASAATAVIIMTRSLPRRRPRVIMDRPFLFGIRSKDGRLLFVGRVDKPAQP